MNMLLLCMRYGHAESQTKNRGTGEGYGWRDGGVEGAVQKILNMEES